MLTPDELALIKADIKAEVIKELTGNDIRTAQANDRPLAGVYQRYKKPLYEKYGVVKWAKTWDAIRMLTTFKLGHRYVRDLLPSEEEKAAKFAEGLLLMMGLEKQDGGA
ncbi:hypothetical protein ACFSR7_35845 [Cohnella sp. GCM10020058]|uniref:hypothetical protein n=1 Tax=Cohnella sp. GCM10020058 TaxID=3317330 RepID=UPI0036397DCE